MTFCQNLANICLHEYARWDDGAGKEDKGKIDGAPKDYYLFVKDYWLSIGNSKLDGKTVEHGIKPAWSSAFVAYCVGKAGAGGKFIYKEAHCHYISAAMKEAQHGKGFAYAARRYEQYKPKIGDIICAGREYASSFTYDQAATSYQNDGFYPSHGDIVVAVEADKVRVIGGNVNERGQVGLEGGIVRDFAGRRGQERPKSGVF
ncbi:DUF2272 domain-containing protein [Sphingobium sp. YR768]|uniref:DUF2272 domain-containing protein n=1 Tax=Sphingobium sp. YR768 TaxID=1884365 RepID=UPI0008B8F38D|nr:DUF2272 domain-containing protein [Sphingobium sp. YR768]SER09574.1 hypothetical protein SAMN05518866_10510 [Sphingobium sp. YR768]